jgi:predicted deacylase
MSARKELAGILEKWLQLTRAEGAAIQAAAWSALGEIQARKAALRKSLAEAMRACVEEEAGSAGKFAPRAFRAEASRILSLLTRNGAALAAQLSRAKAQRESLDQADRNLRRIERSYVRLHPPTAWHSYS